MGEVRLLNANFEVLTHCSMENGECEMALPMKEADDSYLNKENGATVCLTDGSPEMNGSY